MILVEHHDAFRSSAPSEQSIDEDDGDTPLSTKNNTKPRRPKAVMKVSDFGETVDCGGKPVQNNVQSRLTPTSERSVEGKDLDVITSLLDRVGSSETNLMEDAIDLRRVRSDILRQSR